ncbi:MAG: alanine--tRNA ligase [Deltaproteobacteria bacterium]|nr:alanine--tRNA ligase [Deltaproteobacteria bacterium]
MKSAEIRQRFIDYFKKRGHTYVPSSGLVPKSDPTLLFTNAGMVQFKGVFLNEETREYTRAVSCQKCMRAGGKHNDLENVGFTSRHHTFFEMLGNFSFGDYFKKDAIRYAWDFLTNEVKLPADRLWVTVFEDDDEAAIIWTRETGISEKRIVRMGAKDNFWSMGDVGPCGPCSEIIFDQGPGVGCGRPDCAVGCDCDRFLEIWNLVFMQFNRNAAGSLTPLPRPCIDTGMGLERLTSVLQLRHTNYDSDLFMPIIEAIEGLTSVKYSGGGQPLDVSIRAIADHARAITFLITDGVLPSNEGRGYVLRRIIRRAVRHGRLLGRKEPFLFEVCARVIELMGGVYPEIERAGDIVSRAAKGEEERFLETLERGLGLLAEETRLLKERKQTVIPGDVAFKLYDTFGFPLDLTSIIVNAEGFTVDEEGFSRHMDEQKTKARASWKGIKAEAGAVDLYKRLSQSGLKSEFVGYHMEVASSRVLCIIKDSANVDTAFKGDIIEIITAETPFYGESGGQAGDTGAIVGTGFNIRVTDTLRPLNDLIVHRCEVTEGSVSADDRAELIPDLDRRKATRRNHTATHILHAVLRKILGPHVRQAGSLVAPKGFRFDFNHFEALSAEAITKIEDEVNSIILENIEVKTDVLPYQEAIERGALAFFGEKYGTTVRMVHIDGVSTELCGGTHAVRTGDLGLLRITGESSVASGVRRIEAVTGEGAIEEARRGDTALRESAQALKVPRIEVPEKVKKLIEYQRELEREIERLKGKGKSGAADRLAGEARDIKGVKAVVAKADVADPKELREMADALRVKLGSGVVVLAATTQDGKAVLLAAVTRDLAKRISAGEIIKRIAPIVGGRGGGKEDLAQAGGTDGGKIDEAIKAACRVIEELA